MTKGKFLYNILRWISLKILLLYHLKRCFFSTKSDVEPEWNWWVLGFFFAPSGCEKQNKTTTKKHFKGKNGVSIVLLVITGKLFLYQDELTYCFYWLEMVEEKC